MKCPKCKKEIEYVQVYAECWMKGQLKEGINKIRNYGSIKEVFEEIIDICCPFCNERIKDSVEEKAGE